MSKRIIIDILLSKNKLTIDQIWQMHKESSYILKSNIHGQLQQLRKEGVIKRVKGKDNKTGKYKLIIKAL